MKPRSSTFCSVPWTQMATNASGLYRVCCNATPGKNILKDKDGNPMAVNRVSAEEAWNSPVYTQVRGELLSNKRPEMCERCFREEDSGVKSARQRWNERWPFDESYHESPEFNVKYIDLRLGNLCNLKCRMCNPYASSKWIEEWNKVASSAELTPNFSLSDKESERLKTLDWPDDEQTWKNLEPVLETVDEIYLTGGEPFLSLKQVDLLNKFIDSGKSKSITLKYNTNLTIVPERLVESWKHFKQVKINLSIDGIGPLNDYIRHPAKWETTDKNLRKLISLRDNGLPLELSIHTTVQMYNILRLHEIVEAFEQNYNMTPYLNILNHPKCLNIRSLPSSLKKDAAQALEPLKSKPGLEEVLSYMAAEDWENDRYAEFLKYTKDLDAVRGETLAEIEPRLLRP